VLLGFEVHQPFRINADFRRELSRGKDAKDLFDVYFDNPLNRAILERVARKCYLPANRIILENIERFKGEGREFKVVYSLSGVLVEQLRLWDKEVLESFKDLAGTGCVELLDQTYYHSLSSLFSEEREEFIQQVALHRDLMVDLFGQKPRVFENTEFLYNNAIARTLKGLGYAGVFTEGCDRVLGWRSPNHIYESRDGGIAVLTRNYGLSDDIAFRFSARDWWGWPLTAEKFASYLSSSQGDYVNVFIDYETFGEHHWPETGILDFLRWLPTKILEHENLAFKTASEVIDSHPAVGRIDVDDFETVSWADIKRSTDAWLGNDMQRTCFRAAREAEPFVREAGDDHLLRLWRLLQTSDHFYYMYTEPGAPGLVHGYFSSQPPVKAFWSFARILSDLYERLADHLYEPAKTSARILRIISPDETFHFHEDGRYIDLSAHSLDEFRDCLLLASEDSLRFHNDRGDFERWVRHSVGDDRLADELASLKGYGWADLRRRLCECVEQRLRSLRSWQWKS